MRMPRVTIGRLMVVVVFLAFGLSALARPTKLGASILSGSILSSLTVALIGVAIDRGKRRAFFVGFLIAGWSCIVIDYWGEIENLFNRWDFTGSVTTALAEVFNPPPPSPAVLLTPAPVPTTPLPASEPADPLPTPSPSDSMPTPDPTPPSVNVAPVPVYPNVVAANRSAYLPAPSPLFGLTDRDPDVFGRTVHMLLAWTAATAGGLVARWLRATRKEDESA